MATLIFGAFGCGAFANDPWTVARAYTALTNIFLGDSVRVVARRIGVEVSMRMTQYSFDCLTRKYTSVSLGTVADTLEGSAISTRQLASGSITGAKLAINSVGAGQLQSGLVGSLQIKNAAIQSAHIQNASITRAHIAEALIETLNVNALNAVTAKIQELAAGSITTDELYTSIAMIATAQLTTANIINANIEWAQIESLAADIATISKAQITSANIDEANIDWRRSPRFPQRLPAWSRRILKPPTLTGRTSKTSLRTPRSSRRVS